MPDHEECDLESRLRRERSEPTDEFLQQVAATVHGRGRTAHGQSRTAARPRAMFAVASSAGLFVALFAFGGVGVASSALRSSSSMVKAAVGDSPAHNSRGGGSSSSQTPAKTQYHQKVFICRAKIRYVYTYKWIVVEKWSWKSGRHVQRVRVKVVVYVPYRVSAKRVPALVAKGAVYPVPTGGCSSLNHPL